MHIVEFCVSNMHHGTDRVMKKLEELPHIEVIEYGCLGNCGECFLSPYALVNGESVVAETADELYDLVLAEIASQETNKSALDKLLDDL
ncbi:YuzB family protein [Cohnella silvisoli]|uniref:YuzB family protein n=1 Tax=Cohnella silvisoli TaxID=2873699 RepID=A0ABV1KXX5_9BACL|nr:YuzB family protein [Cohnella silvisoli]MCD9023943.1 YuzB family protein [Cohnella silvisoli]